MSIRVLDLIKQPQKCTFANSPCEELSFAEAFWHSVRLQPTVESRLVSSDIKQRLGTRKKAPKSTDVPSGQQLDDEKKLKQFFTRARTLDQIAEFQHLRKLAEARMEDRNMLHKRRQERINKEEISKGRFPKKLTLEQILAKKDEKKRKIGEAYSIKEMIREIDEFEMKKQDEDNAGDTNK